MPSRLDILAGWVQTRDRSTGCWEWPYGGDGRGYGALAVARKPRRASRVAVALDGRNPTGWFVCHTCDNRRCVNPAHLYLGTASTNAADKSARGRWRGPGGATQTHCKQGHEYTPDNTYRRPDRTNERRCRICRDEANARRNARPQ